MKPKLKALLSFLAVIALSISVVIFSRLITAIGPETSQPILIKRPTCNGTLIEYNSLVQQGRDVVLVKNYRSRAENGHFVPDPKKVTVYRTGSAARIACGYLHIVASIAHHPLDESGETVYISPGGFGGHIDTSNPIVPIQPGDGTSEYLLDLTNISYSEGAKISYKLAKKISYSTAQASQATHTADWATLLNVSTSTDFRIALSTTDYRGVIRQIDIAYVCWNPDTGKLTTECKLSTQSPSR